MSPIVLLEALWYCLCDLWGWMRHKVRRVRWRAQHTYDALWCWNYRRRHRVR
jgi:hypothetical protein